MGDCGARVGKGAGLKLEFEAGGGVKIERRPSRGAYRESSSVVLLTMEWTTMLATPQALEPRTRR